MVTGTMDYIEFDATLEKEGIIHIPEEYRKEVESSKRVHVTLYPVNGKSQKRNDAIQELLDHPIYAPNFIPLRETRITHIKTWQYLSILTFGFMGLLTP